MARRRKIAIAATDVYAMNVLGQGQLEFLRDNGAELTLICGGNPAEIEKLRKRKLGRVIHLPFRRPPHPFYDLLTLVLLLGIFGMRRFDTVVASTPKAMLLASLAAAATFQPYRIAFVRGRAYENDRGLKRAFYLLLDRTAFRCAHLVLFVSPSLKDSFQSDGLAPAGKCRVLGYGSSNGVDMERFKQLDSTAVRRKREQLGIPVDAFQIVSVGRITADKGVAEMLVLIDRLRDRRDIHWTFVGMVEDEQLADKIAKFDPQNVTHVHHTMSVQDWLATADLHLLLSKREGLANVNIEAGACGTPTFGFNTVGVRDSIVDTMTGLLFNFGDLKSIEAAIRAAADDKKPFRESFKNAREVVRERFERAMVWNSYRDVYYEKTS